MNNYKTLIIAESGVNHNGSIDIAKKLIDVASDSGADYVKFQTFIADDLVTQLAEKAEYQNKAIGNKTHYEMLKDLELNKQDHLDLINYCTNRSGNPAILAALVKTLNIFWNFLQQTIPSWGK